MSIILGVNLSPSQLVPARPGRGQNTILSPSQSRYSITDGDRVIDWRLIYDFRTTLSGRAEMMKKLNLFDIIKTSSSFLASPSQCRKCTSLVWSVLSQAGFPILLDPERIGPQADLDLYLKRRLTYRCYRVAGGFEANWRSQWELKNADYERDIYLAVHACDPTNIRTELTDYWKAYK